MDSEGSLKQRCTDHLAPSPLAHFKTEITKLIKHILGIAVQIIRDQIHLGKDARSKRNSVPI